MVWVRFRVGSSLVLALVLVLVLMLVLVLELVIGIASASDKGGLMFLLGLGLHLLVICTREDSSHRIYLPLSVPTGLDSLACHTSSSRSFKPDVSISCSPPTPASPSTCSQWD